MVNIVCLRYLFLQHSVASWLHKGTKGHCMRPHIPHCQSKIYSLFSHTKTFVAAEVVQTFFYTISKINAWYYIHSVKERRKSTQC